MERPTLPVGLPDDIEDKKTNGRRRHDVDHEGPAV